MASIDFGWRESQYGALQVHARLHSAGEDILVEMFAIEQGKGVKGWGIEVWCRKAGSSEDGTFLTRAMLGVSRSTFLGGLPHADGSYK